MYCFDRKSATGKEKERCRRMDKTQFRSLYREITGGKIDRFVENGVHNSKFPTLGNKKDKDSSSKRGTQFRVRV
jgi:hypothetical protein